MLILPLLFQPSLVERDLRMRNHAGGLARFYLDALLGLVAIRTHAAEPAVVREHDERLGEWARAAWAAVRTAITAESMQALVGFGLVAWLLFDYLTTRARFGLGAAAGVLVDDLAGAGASDRVPHPAVPAAPQRHPAPGRAAQRTRDAGGWPPFPHRRRPRLAWTSVWRASGCASPASSCWRSTICTCRRVRRWPWWAAPGQARAAWPDCCSAGTNRRRGNC
jgi:hypothetical protein